MVRTPASRWWTSIAALAVAGSLPAACDREHAGPQAGATAEVTRPAAPGATTTASDTPGDLGAYTDPGDGCSQAISAIGYADDELRPLGQEPYQEFDDVVRSRLAAVAGTLALEAKDWPDEPVHAQAAVVQPLAQAAGAALTDTGPAAARARATTLLRYRIEAGKLVLFCRDAAPESGPAPSSRR